MTLEKRVLEEAYNEIETWEQTQDFNFVSETSYIASI